MLPDIRPGIKVRGLQHAYPHMTKNVVYTVKSVVKMDGCTQFQVIECDSGNDCLPCQAVGKGWEAYPSDYGRWFEFFEDPITLTPEELASSVLMDKSKLSDLERFLK